MNYVTKEIILALMLLFCTAARAHADTISDSTTTTTTDVTPPETTGDAASQTTVTETTTTTTVTDIDAKIIANIYDKFAKDSALIGTQLTVSSVNGEVTLSGSVTAQSQADAAVIDAKSIDGVKIVTSTITVTTNPAANQPVNPTPNY